jgi:hydroxymethylglutaryl-CoA lyase
MDPLFNPFPLRVDLTECFARDGLQSLDRVFSTEEKLKFLNRIRAIGFKRIEVTSLVPPRYLPQFYDAEEVLHHVLQGSAERGGGILHIVFVPNARGAFRLEPFARDFASDLAILTVVSATETHNYKNLRHSRSETMEEQKKIADFAQRYGIRLIGSISVAFGCPYEGSVPFSEVLLLVEHYMKLGYSEIQLGDTIGVANPLQVEEYFSELLREFPGVTAIAHFHDNRGRALANSLVAISQGAKVVDTCLGGLGGRPPDQRIQRTGPTGNTSSEDLAFLLEEMGVHTGLDLSELLGAGAELCQVMNDPLYSHTVHSHYPASESQPFSIPLLRASS